MTTYRSHVGFNQQLLTDLSVVENGELALKSVYKDEVVESSSSSFKKSDSSEIKSYNQGGAQETDLMSIDSCTKTITADAFRKMLQEHPDKFPEGLKTKANHFTELLKSRFPNSDYVQGRKSPNLEEELTEQITLRDLLNHTSGLGNQTHKDFDERIKSNPNHRLREGELLEIDRKKGEYGKSEYSNQGYELLGMIMCAVEQDIQRRDAVADPVQFSEVLEKYSLKPRGLAGQIFASDQMIIVDGKVEVKDHPELKVTSGQYYHDSKVHQSRPFNYDQFGAGGCYASSSAMVSYIESFNYADFAAIFESEKSRVSKVEHAGKSYAMLQECAGFNSLVLEEASGRIDINFGGKGCGTNSGALATFYSDGRKDLSFTVLNGEDLTYPIAVALIKKEKLEATKYPAMDDEIHKKITELKSVFSQEQLIEIRKGLDKSYEEFVETYRQQKDVVSMMIASEKERKALKTNFSKIDNPSENLSLSSEARVKMADSFAQAKIDEYLNFSDEAKKQKFISRRTTDLLGKEDDLDAIAEMSEAIKDKEKLSNLFLRLEDKKLVEFNWNKDGFAAFKPADLSEESIQKYCDDIDFRGVMVVEDRAGNQTKVSNYHKGTQADPEDRPFATHSVSKLIGGVTMCKMIADGIIPQTALDEKLELSEDVRKKLPEEILKHLENHNVTLRDVMTHHSGLGGYLDPELKKGQLGYEDGKYKLGYGVNGYSGYVRQQLEKSEEVEVPNSPQDYLKYSERETYKHGKFKYSDLGIVLASLSAEHHYNQKNPNAQKTFEEIIREQLITPAGVERFSAQKPADALCHSDDPIAPYITGTAGCGYFTNLDGLVKIGKHIGEMWQENETFREVVKDCGSEFYDKEKQIIKHPGGIDSSKTLLSVDLNNGSVVVTEERRLGSDFPFPGWGVVTAARNINKEQELQKSEMKVLTEDSIQTTDQKWSEKYPSKKSAEAKNVIESKKSWKDVLEKTNKSKDDSTITRSYYQSSKT